MPEPTTSTSMPAPQRHALVLGEGPLVAAVSRALREDGWVLSPNGRSERWLFLIARGSETEASPLITTMREFALNLGAGTSGGIVLLLDLSHAQPRAGEPPPPFAAALAQRSLAAAVPLLALEFAPRLRVNAIGTLPTGPMLPQGTPEADIAAALRFIIDAPALTGQMIALDGGRTSLVPAPAPGTPDLT